MPNLHKVNADLYRGAQPTAEGVQQLKAMGVKTIICLRQTNPDTELLGNSGLKVVWIPMRGTYADDAANAEFLRVVSDRSRGPFFVHCKRGADRTGETVALYRIAVQGWEREAAIDEMQRGGYGFLPLLQNLVWYLRSVDVHRLTASLPVPERVGPG